MEKHMFRVYDANDDGHVDFVEFMVSSSLSHQTPFIFIQMIFYIMNDGSAEEVLARIFRVFDVNRSLYHNFRLYSFEFLVMEPFLKKSLAGL